MNEQFIHILKDIVGKENVKSDEPMSKHTSFEIGGPADFLVTPENMIQLRDLISICGTHNIPYFIMGNGTNLLVADKGIRGVVIKTSEKFQEVTIHENEIKAQSGIRLSTLAKGALKAGLRGLEFASGVPGTLGGAVVMNAGAYGGEMKDVVISTRFMGENGNVIEIEGEQHEFGYRTSIIQKRRGIVLESTLRLEKGNKEEIKAKMKDLNSRRKNKQPLEMPSAGSTFRRPPGYYAGKLIEDSGLKGYRIGGAEVSTKHCGFIVNKGNATASEVMAVIEHVKSCVFQKFGVKLQTEIKLVGE